MKYNDRDYSVSMRPEGYRIALKDKNMGIVSSLYVENVDIAIAIGQLWLEKGELGIIDDTVIIKHYTTEGEV